MNNTALAAFLGMLSLLLGCNGGKPLPDVYRYDKGAVFLDPGQPGSWNISHTCTYTNSSSSCHAVLSVVNMTCGCVRWTPSVGQKWALDKLGWRPARPLLQVWRGRSG
jgi:hypothetical protein